MVPPVMVSGPFRVVDPLAASVTDGYDDERMDEGIELRSRITHRDDVQKSIRLDIGWQSRSLAMAW